MCRYLSTEVRDKKPMAGWHWWFRFLQWKSQFELNEVWCTAGTLQWLLCGGNHIRGVTFQKNEWFSLTSIKQKHNGFQREKRTLPVVVWRRLNRWSLFHFEKFGESPEVQQRAQRFSWLFFKFKAARLLMDCISLWSLAFGRGIIKLKSNYDDCVMTKPLIWLLFVSLPLPGKKKAVDAPSIARFRFSFKLCVTSVYLVPSSPSRSRNVHSFLTFSLILPSWDVVWCLWDVPETFHNFIISYIRTMNCKRSFYNQSSDLHNAWRMYLLNRNSQIRFIANIR